MSFLVQQNIVKYACTCGELKPISRLYFCRHCLKIRCRFCVSHEVDAYFCPTCNENYPSSEAWMKKNSCLNCYNCPSCCNTLTVRVASVHTKSDKSSTSGDGLEKPEVPKKFYYLVCFFCHWSTRDVGIPDATIAFKGWPDMEGENNEKVSSIFEYFKSLAIFDRTEREKRDKKHLSQRRHYSHISGLSKAMAMKKAGLDPSTYGLIGLSDYRKPPKMDHSLPVTAINDLPSDIFNIVPDLNKSTTLIQRFTIPDIEPVTVSGLKPCKKLLSTKTSQRCRTCEHNVSKPEYNPGSIKFKIQLSAYYHVTEVRLMTCDLLHAGRPSQFIIKLINPTQHQTVIQFLPFDQNSIENKGEENSLNGQEKPSLPSSLLTKVRSVEIKPRSIDVKLNGSISLPSESFILPQRDDAAEYDDTSDSQNFSDNPHVVWWKGNKVAIRLEVTPDKNVKVGTPVLVGFIMTYSYINTMIQKKEQQKVCLQVSVVINLGSLVASD